MCGHVRRGKRGQETTPNLKSPSPHGLLICLLHSLCEIYSRSRNFRVVCVRISDRWIPVTTRPPATKRVIPSHRSQRVGLLIYNYRYPGEPTARLLASAACNYTLWHCSVPPVSPANKSANKTQWLAPIFRLLKKAVEGSRD